MMHFVREWNAEVEVSLHSTHKTVEMDQTITELQTQTTELEGFLAEKNEEIEEIQKRNEELELGKSRLLQNFEDVRESLKGKLHLIITHIKSVFYILRKKKKGILLLLLKSVFMTIHNIKFHNRINDNIVKPYN